MAGGKEGWSKHTNAGAKVTKHVVYDGQLSETDQWAATSCGLRVKNKHRVVPTQFSLAWLACLLILIFYRLILYGTSKLAYFICNKQLCRLIDQNGATEGIGNFSDMSFIHVVREGDDDEVRFGETEIWDHECLCHLASSLPSCINKWMCVVRSRVPTTLTVYCPCMYRPQWLYDDRNI